MTLEGLNEDFRDLSVGAYALAFHGAPRASGDIDLFIRPSADNARRLFGALMRFGAPLASAGVTAADFEQAGIVYQLGLPPRRIDLLTEISGLTFDEAWASRVAAEVEGCSVNFIGRDALVKNKAATGRAKDIADIARLRKLPERDDR